MHYGKIKPVDIANGEGVRVSVFVSGCPHHCKSCFNPELWDYDACEEFTYEEISKIIDLCSKDYISGLSLLGGEPLDPRNVVGMITLCKAFVRKFPHKNIWCYTGYDWKEVKDLEIMHYIDVLVDGKFVEDLKDPRLKFRGSSNQRIIDVKKSLESGNVVVRKDIMGE